MALAESCTHSDLVSTHMPMFVSLSLMSAISSDPLRGKIQELNLEILRLSKDIDTYNQESATYLTFEKR